MSGLESLERYGKELADLDHEIRLYAGLCGLDLSHPSAVEAFMSGRSEFKDRHETLQEHLRGLLFLRQEVETELLRQGIEPPPLRFHPAPDQVPPPDGGGPAA